MQFNQQGNTKKRFLSPVILVMGFVSFFTDMSGQMIVPILPLFLTTALGVGVETIGIIEGIAESTASLLKLFSGWITDRFGHYKLLMVLGYGLSNLIKPFFAFSTSWGTVLTIRFGDRIGKGIRTSPRDAFLANTTSKEERGKAFGFRRSMDTLGAAIGPLLAFAILAYHHENYRLVFLLSAVPGILSVLLLIFFLKEKSGTRSISTARALPTIGFKNMNKRFKWFTWIYTLFTLGNFSDAFLILRAQNVGVTAALIPLTYFSYNIVASLFSTPVGILSDRIGRRPVLIAGFLIFAVMYFGFGWVKTPASIWVLFFLYGLYYAATDGIQKAYIADLVPQEQRGIAMGTFNALTGIAALPASILAGFFWQYFGAMTAFGVSSLLAVLAAVSMILFRI